MNVLMSRLSGRLARYLSQPGRTGGTAIATDQQKLARCLQPGDVLLVEGTTRVSTAIKYLTQSTWSHAALYVGDVVGRQTPDGAALCFVEADIVQGVRAVALSNFKGLHCRVCRPVSLTGDEVRQLCDFAVSRLGEQYDMKNVFDLVRYLFPTPPVPVHWRRRMLSMGSGDPTRAICSTLLAQCFESVRYPILPRVEQVSAANPGSDEVTREILHVRHYSLYVPRDFDVSPYFQIIKPTLDAGFDHHALAWDFSRP
jgi:Permuted papain-like amidase enzyme, YaeF/YiiX, C92 family